MALKTEILYFDSKDELFTNAQSRSSSSVIVADYNTAGFADGRECIRLMPGEKNKTLSSVQQVIDRALERKLGRDSAIIALGGGVVCDAAGFAASVYMRGCRLVNIPTTLLAMVDAAYGGKTGFDYGGAKNSIGTFYPAEAVLIWPGFLDTLSREEYRNGMGEVIKSAMLDGTGELMALLEKGIADRKDRLDMIRLSLKTKAMYVGDDLNDTSGRREALNLGHTFAHALEAVSGYTVAHGTAVAWGLGCSLRCGKCSDSYRSRVEALLGKYGFAADVRISKEKFGALTQAMLLDKKRKCGKIRFVLPAGPGKTETASLTQEELYRSVVQ